MKRILVALAVCLAADAICMMECAIGQIVAQMPEAQVVDSATGVLQEIMAVPAKQIPQSLLSSARGIAIVPNVVKGGFVVGVRHGRGVMLVRNDQGQWQPPTFITLTGGSIGWQAGIQATDVILVFRTRNSVVNLMNGKLTIGVDAAASAGPVGRNVAASTDVTLKSEILSYSRSRGLFAGAAVDGSVISVDYPAGVSFYRHTGVVNTGQPVSLPPSAARLIGQLDQYSGGPTAAAGTHPETLPHLVSSSSVARPDAELIRQQLAASCAALQKLLDPQWKSFLALPREVYVPDRPPQIDGLRQTLQRYETVAQDQRFAALTQRTEFTTTLRLLREYTTLFAGNSSAALALPPPPAATRP